MLSSVLALLQTNEESFCKSWVTMQRKSKILAFQLATQTVNTLASQMWMVIFVRFAPSACLLACALGLALSGMSSGLAVPTCMRR